jgi:hypothetical protein
LTHENSAAIAATNAQNRVERNRMGAAFRRDVR